MRILFSEALVLGSIVMPHGRGGGKPGSACALEAALIAVGRAPFVRDCLSSLFPGWYVTNYGDVVREWPYMGRICQWPSNLQYGETPLFQAVFEASDAGQPRGIIVDMVKDHEKKWGIKPTPELSAPVGISAVVKDGQVAV